MYPASTRSGQRAGRPAVSGKAELAEPRVFVDGLEVGSGPLNVFPYESSLFFGTRTQAAAERQLAREDRPRERRGRDLPIGAQHLDRDHALRVMSTTTCWPWSETETRI